MASLAEVLYNPEMMPGGERITRRRLLLAGAGGGLIAAVGVVELVSSGTLPGKSLIERLDGACSVPAPAEAFATTGPTVMGDFYSRARGRVVGYTIAYPPGHRPGSRLPLVLYLYGEGGSQTSTLGGISPARALAGRARVGALAPMAIGVADGGSALYWNAHPGDDPMRMLTDEFIPLCRGRGLGVGTRRIGALGISMGGYGALLLTEKCPDLIAATAVISPAIWTTYEQARAVNPQAFASATAFARNDVISGGAQLRDVPVRIASGTDDPFHPGVLALAGHLPRTAHVELTAGCHDDGYFAEQQLPSLQFLGQHLAA